MVVEHLTWGDVDEQEGRWRVSASVARQARPGGSNRRRHSCSASQPYYRATTAPATAASLTVRPETVSGRRFTRACTAAGVPAFSPHDLRHRRATLWHLGGLPAAQASAWLGHSAQEHLRTYAHAVLDRTEIDYENFSASDLRNIPHRD